MNLRLDAEPEWAIAYLVEYVSACLCAAIVGVTLAIFIL